MGVVHLRYVGTGLGAAWLAVQAREAQLVEGLIGSALAAVFGSQVGRVPGIAALGDPARVSKCRQAGTDVDLGRPGRNRGWSSQARRSAGSASPFLWGYLYFTNLMTLQNLPLSIRFIKVLLFNI